MEEQQGSTARVRGLTPTMWRVLMIVGVVAALVIVGAAWFIAASGADPDETAATPRASSPVPTTPGPLPGATPTTGSEVPPPSPSTPGSDRLPSLPPTAPLIAAPLPASASGDGELVKGFPAELAGPAPDAQVVQNAIATEGDVMQVSLVARTDASPAEISAHYAQLWASKGLAPQPASADGSMAYTSAFESLTLAFTPATGTGTVYTVHGVFRTI